MVSRISLGRLSSLLLKGCDILMDAGILYMNWMNSIDLGVGPKLPIPEKSQRQEQGSDLTSESLKADTRGAETEKYCHVSG